MEEEKKYINLIFSAPQGYIFKECPLCSLPFLYDGKLNNCMWCEIHKEEHEEKK